MPYCRFDSIRKGLSECMDRDSPFSSFAHIKSTFSVALEELLPRFRRCNQDDLGTRVKVEKTVREALAAGQSVCIDRTNIDAK